MVVEPDDQEARVGGDSEASCDDEQSKSAPALESFEHEWYSHIPHSVILDDAAPTIYAAAAYYARSGKNTIIFKHHGISLIDPASVSINTINTRHRMRKFSPTPNTA